MRNEKGQFIKGERSAFWRHGMRHTRFGEIYYGITKRCTNPKDKRFAQYGGKGVKNLWATFEDFRDDMYESYLQHSKEFGEKQTTIDRIDNSGNYCKENCRWATWKEQSQNRDLKLITYNGKTQRITQWCEELNKPIHLLWLRIYRYGWDIERAFTAPVGPTSRRYK